MPHISEVNTDTSSKFILKMQTHISIVYAPRIPKLIIVALSFELYYIKETAQLMQTLMTCSDVVGVLATK